MAKAKKDVEQTDKNVAVDEIDLAKEFEDEFGEGIFISANSFLDKPKHIIPLAPKIDIAMNGGIPEGSTVLCSGQPKTGKTTTALSFAASCQKQENGSRHVYYLDVEGRLKHMNLKGIKGLDFNKFTIIQSSEDKILSAEEFLTAAVKILMSKKNCLVILDSASALCASKEQIGEITASTRNDGPKLLASFFRKIANVIPVRNNILWIMQHLIADTSGYGSGYKEDGGQKVQYQADVKIRVKYSEPWKAGAAEDAKQIGQQIHWKIITSALGGLPNQESETFIRYGVGIDEVKEFQDLAESLAILQVKGAWCKFVDEKLPDGELNLNGREKMYQYLVESKEHFELLKQRVKEMLGI